MVSKFSSFTDEKMQKSLLNLKYLAYLFILIVVIVGVGFNSYFGYKLLASEKYKSFSVHTIAWMAAIYFVAIMILLGIKDVLIMLTNLSKGNIFTHENAEILRRVDKKLLITLIFSIIVNMIMAIAGFTSFQFMFLWLVFISFLLAGHILVNPLALLVEKSADMQIEMDLTI